MTKNMGKADQAIRLILGAVFAILFFTTVVTGPLGIVFLILAILLLVTGALRVCPIYMLFGIDTNNCPPKGDKA